MSGPLSPEWVRDQYGSWRSLLRTEAAQMRWRLGAWRNAERVDWSRTDALAFVCTGNICRSAYGEARVRATGAAARSCGIEGLPDKFADPDAIRAAERRGLDLTTHRTQNLVACAERYESEGARPLWICLEPKHLRRVQALYPEAEATLLGLWGANPRPLIPDPFGGGDGQFDYCMAWIDACIERLLADRAAAS